MIHLPDPPTRCLVVDDEPLVRRSVVRMLEPLGFRCIEAGSGRQGLDALESAGELPLIISDLRMPELDGMGFLTEVRRRWPDTAVVMLSGSEDEDMARSLLKAGAMDYIRKPFQFDQLLQAVSLAVEVGKGRPRRGVVLPFHPDRRRRPVSTEPEPLRVAPRLEAQAAPAQRRS